MLGEELRREIDAVDVVVGHPEQDEILGQAVRRGFGLHPGDAMAHAVYGAKGDVRSAGRIVSVLPIGAAAAKTSAILQASIWEIMPPLEKPAV